MDGIQRQQLRQPAQHHTAIMRIQNQSPAASFVVALLCILSILSPIHALDASSFGQQGGTVWSPVPSTSLAPSLSPTLLPSISPTSLQATDPPRVEGSTERVSFTMLYGFEEGKTSVEPTLNDINELACITNQYIAAQVQETLATRNDTRPIQAFATNIDWTYNSSDPYWQAALSFLADVRYADSSTVVDKALVFEAFELDGAAVSEYITDHVWLASPASIFYGTVRVRYNVEMNSDVPSGKLEEATCQDYTRTPTMTPTTHTPTISPTVSADPTMSPTHSVVPSALPTISSDPSLMPTSSPTAAPSVLQTVSSDATDHMVYFQMDVLLTADQQSSNDGNETSTWTDNLDYVVSVRDMQTVMCHTNTFFQQRVQSSLSNNSDEDVSIDSTASNIYWVHSETTMATTLTVYFTADTTLGDSSVDLEVVRTAVMNATANTALLEHLTVEGREDVFMTSITNVTLQDLPVGTPVRAGRLQVGACPTTTPTATPSTNGDTVPTTSTSQANAVPAGSNNMNSDGNGSNADDDPVRGNSANLLYAETTMTIMVEFLVSNLDFLTSSNAVLNDGLSRSFPSFLKDLVPSLQTAPATQRKQDWQQDQSVRASEKVANLRRTRQRGLRKQQQRTLHDYGTISLQQGSARAYQATKVQCGPYVHPDLTCHEVKAKYDLIMPIHQEHDDAVASTTMEDANDIRRIYQVATYRAILDGTFYAVMKRQVPDTSLFIGTVPRPSTKPSKSSGGFASDATASDWIVIALSVTLGLVCCCVLCCICHRCYEHHQYNRDLDPDEEYEREMFRQGQEIERELQAQKRRQSSPQRPSTIRES